MKLSGFTSSRTVGIALLIVFVPLSIAMLAALIMHYKDGKADEKIFPYIEKVQRDCPPLSAAATAMVMLHKHVPDTRFDRNDLAQVKALVRAERQKPGGAKACPVSDAEAVL